MGKGEKLVYYNTSHTSIVYSEENFSTCIFRCVFVQCATCDYLCVRVYKESANAENLLLCIIKVIKIKYVNKLLNGKGSVSFK